MRVKEYPGEVLETYPQVVRYLLEPFATDEIIQEAYAEVTDFRESRGTTEFDYVSKRGG